MLNDHQTTAADRMAENMLRDEIKYQKQRNAERFAKLPASHIAEYGERLRGDCRKFAEEILTPQGLWNRARRGAFHPSNKNWRKLLEELYPEQLPHGLPRGANRTRDAVRAIVGAETWDSFEKEITDAKEQEEQKRREEAEAKRNAMIGRIIASIKANNPITGDELVDAARSLGIEIHPRTVALLRDRVISINSESARITGRNSGMAFQVYRDVVNALKEPTAEPDAEPAADAEKAAELFKVR